MRKISANLVFPVTSAPIKNAVLVLDEQGKIISINSLDQHDSSTVEHFEGAIIPGFVNAHCHLELSHMKGKVETGTGLIPFINAVVTKRNVPQEEIQNAIQQADKEMWEAGIMAVGDISNTTDTFATKQNSCIRYASFIEMFDLLQAQDAEKTFDNYYAVFEALNLKKGDTKTVVPHAPYSVSIPLFQKIKNANTNKNATISIHNQETPPENQLFLTGDGAFVDWYQSFDLELKDFKATGQPSIYYALEHLQPSHNNLFVHNTLTTKEDIQAAQKWSNNTYWATCPNANLYIENRLPNYQHFLDTNAKVCIGTDSLTSNWQLSILNEMKTIAKYQSYVNFETLLEWACLNGAQALGFEDELGSFEIGKKPGVLFLENFDGQLHSSTRIKRVI